MRCAIWYNLYNLKNVKNGHRVLLLVKLQALTCNLAKSNTPPRVFGTKSRKASHMNSFSFASTVITVSNIA